MWKVLLPIVFLVAVVYCGTPPPYGSVLQFNTVGNIGYQRNFISNGYTYARFSALDDIATEDNTDAVDGWFYLGVANLPVVGGGLLQQSSAISPRGDHVVITGSSFYNYFGVSIDSTLRVDSQGWATILWEFTNLAGTQFSQVINNQDYDNLGSDLSTAVFVTSDGDTVFNNLDDWAVTFDTNERDPVVGFSFGRGALNQNQYQSFYDVFAWAHLLDLQPFESKNILAVLAVGNHYPNTITYYDLLNMYFRLHSVLTHERNFYNYITADGYGLLDHLTYQQLFYADNWNFIGAGIAGKLESDSESRVVRLDGSIEQITPEPGVYCLFEDRVLQVNFRLSSAGVVDEVVVFAREHGMSFHASLDLNGQPEFLIDGRSVEIPMSRFDGTLVTESAPFQIPFTHIPLSALGEYHVNSLHFRDVFTVVGGYHPEMGGFFNVAVHRRASENRFPGLLNVPSGAQLRDVGFGASVVPDIWFNLSQ